MRMSEECLICSSPLVYKELAEMMSRGKFVRENFGVEMVKSDVVCKYFPRNNQCIGTRCPFRKS